MASEVSKYNYLLSPVKLTEPSVKLEKIPKSYKNIIASLIQLRLLKTCM